MKLKFLLAGLVGLFVALGTLQAEDKIAAIDHKARTITVGHKPTIRTYTVDPIAEITLNGEKSDFSKLAVGMDVHLSLADEHSIREITATGVAKTPKKKGKGK